MRIGEPEGPGGCREGVAGPAVCVVAGACLLGAVDGGGSGDSLDCGPDVDHYKVYLGDTVTGCEIPF